MTHLKSKQKAALIPSLTRAPVADLAGWGLETSDLLLPIGVMARVDVTKSLGEKFSLGIGIAGRCHARKGI
jgi:hypothetical protein